MLDETAKRRTEKCCVRTGSEMRSTLRAGDAFLVSVAEAPSSPRLSQQTVNLKIGSDFIALFLQVEVSEIKNGSWKGEPSNTVCVRAAGCAGASQTPVFVGAGG